VKITIGLTRTDRAADYVPAMDGYRPGAAQDLFVIEVESPAIDPAVIGEAFFVATNAPKEVVDGDRLASALYREITRKLPIAHRLTLSVGDTVQVDDGPVFVVAPVGFEPLPSAA
jgi:hypothetical protein